MNQTYKCMVRPVLEDYELENLSNQIDQDTKGFGGDSDYTKIQCGTLATLLDAYMQLKKSTIWGQPIVFGQNLDHMIAGTLMACPECGGFIGHGHEEICKGNNEKIT